MKIILKVLLIALPLIGKSQITDTTCIESRWISIKPMEANKNIFLQNEKDTVDLVYTLKKLVENKKINTRGVDESLEKVLYLWFIVEYLL